MSHRVISQPLVASRGSARNPLGRYQPQKVTDNVRWEFIRQRRAEYLERVGGEPTLWQTSLISNAIDAGWNAFENGMIARTLQGDKRIEALRVAAEFKRQLMLHERDLEKTLPKPAPAATSKRKPGPAQIGLDEHLAMLRGRREGAA